MSTHRYNHPHETQYQDPYAQSVPLVPIELSTMDPAVQKQSSLDEEEEEMLKKGMVDWNALKKKEFWFDRKMISTCRRLTIHFVTDMSSQSGISSSYYSCTHTQPPEMQR